MSDGLTPEQSEEEKKMLGYPSMRPMDFDGTLEAWLLRLTVWGTVVIKYKHPENFNGTREVNNDYFLDTVGNTEDNKLFGPWSIDQLTANRLIFYRQYEAVDGENYKQEFDIEIKLKPSLQHALDKVQKKSEQLEPVSSEVIPQETIKNGGKIGRAHV